MKILVIDDEKGVGDLFTNLISKEKHKLTYISNGKDALKILENEHFNIVFCDIIMPILSGVKILEKIKSSSPKTKVIMMTGKMLDGDLINEIIKNKADGCLKKPFEINEVLKIIKEAEKNNSH